MPATVQADMRAMQRFSGAVQQLARMSGKNFEAVIRHELAAVLSYVRQSFGNDGELISAEAVRRVREATKDRANFYMVEDILKEHPMVKREAPAPVAAPAPAP